MAYSEEALQELEEKFQQLHLTKNNILLELYSFQEKLTADKAKEYLLQGVARRLKTLSRCIDNIFKRFPPAQTENLSSDDLADISINLHAFFINIAGVFDNLAWVFIFENNLLGRPRDGKVSRNGVGLFSSSTQEHLPKELNDYLTSEPIESWYIDYSKTYRDSLAHRIPLYVPPTLLNKEDEKSFRDIEEQKQNLDFSKETDRKKYDELNDSQKKIGQASHFFSDTLSEGCAPAYIHAQILADFVTVEEVISMFCETFKIKE